MVGTRATGRTTTYRYYTCWNLTRYNASKCDMARLNADAIAQAQHADRHAELAAVDHELTKTGAAIGPLPDRLRARHPGRRTRHRPTHQTPRHHQALRIRHHELTLALNDEPTTPEPATLQEVADQIAEIITSGTHNQIKALVETLVAKVTITGPDRLTPVFRIPNPARTNDDATTALPETAPTREVRTMTKSVGLVGPEPSRRCVRCSYGKRPHIGRRPRCAPTLTG